jgi:hypothetical protein
MPSSNTPLLNLSLLIDVTFSTPTPDYAKESVGAGVESGSSDTMLKRRALHLALLLLALHCAAHARKKRVYEHGVLTTRETLELNHQCVSIRFLRPTTRQARSAIEQCCWVRHVGHW